MIKKGLLRNRDFAIKPAAALTLFDAYIKPILMYNCEVWASARWRNYSKCDPDLLNLDKTESIHTNVLCKYILGAAIILRLVQSRL